jgi:hypothetical protein
MDEDVIADGEFLRHKRNVDPSPRAVDFYKGLKAAGGLLDNL